MMSEAAPAPSYLITAYLITSSPHHFVTQRRPTSRRLLLLQCLTAERLREIAQELRELACHQCEVDVELFFWGEVRVAFFFFFLHRQELQSLHFELVGEHEGDAIVPRQSKARHELA